jgi:voltage-gated potassium channel
MILKSEGPPRKTWRHRLYTNLQPAVRRNYGMSFLNKVIVTTICLAVATAIIETEPTIRQGNEGLFRTAEIVFAVIFSIEYAARVWTSVENPAYGPGLRGHLSYIFSVPALIDLLALMTLFMTLFGSHGAFLRLFRLVRIFMLAKLGRYSTALGAIGHAVTSRRHELIMSLAIAGVLLVASATLLFICESAGQPEAFGSIPRAMWWAVATLTTVGYGDAVPMTALGKIIAGVTAVTGVGLIAVPTGILAAAFSDAMQRQREERERRAREKEDEDEKS